MVLYLFCVGPKTYWKGIISSSKLSLTGKIKLRDYGIFSLKEAPSRTKLSMFDFI